MAKVTITYTPSELYYRYKALCFTTLIRSIVIEDRYHRLSFKPHIPKIGYFYFDKLSKECKDSDSEKSKRYYELSKIFEGSINYQMEKIRDSMIDDIGVPIELIFSEDEKKSYDNYLKSIEEMYKDYYLTDDVTVTMEEN